MKKFFISLIIVIMLNSCASKSCNNNEKIEKKLDLIHEELKDINEGIGVILTYQR